MRSCWTGAPWSPSSCSNPSRTGPPAARSSPASTRRALRWGPGCSGSGCCVPSPPRAGSRAAPAVGARLPRQWLLRPLLDLGEIGGRQAAVAALVEAPALRAEVGGLLGTIGDLERLTSRVALGVAHCRDLIALRNCLAPLPRLKQVPAGLPAPPLARRAGAGREARERERTGIGALRVRFNRVFGYSIEVSNAHLAKVPEDYVRRQTLVGAERFVTPELKEYEAKGLGGGGRSNRPREGGFVG